MTADLDEEGLLAVGCGPEGLQLMLALGEPPMATDPMGFSSGIRVRYSLDGDTGPAFRVWFGDGETVRMPANALRGFLGEAPSREQASFEAVDAIGETRNYRFSLGGFSETLGRLPCDSVSGR